MTARPLSPGHLCPRLLAVCVLLFAGADAFAGGPSGQLLAVTSAAPYVLYLLFLVPAWWWHRRQLSVLAQGAASSVRKADGVGRWLRGLAVVLAVIGFANMRGLLANASALSYAVLAALLGFSLLMQIVPAVLIWWPSRHTWPFVVAGVATTTVSLLPLLGVGALWVNILGAVAFGIVASVLGLLLWPRGATYLRQRGVGYRQTA